MTAVGGVCAYVSLIWVRCWWMEHADDSLEPASTQRSLPLILMRPDVPAAGKSKVSTPMKGSLALKQEILLKSAKQGTRRRIEKFYTDSFTTLPWPAKPLKAPRQPPLPKRMRPLPAGGVDEAEAEGAAELALADALALELGVLPPPD